MALVILLLLLLAATALYIHRAQRRLPDKSSHRYFPPPDFKGLFSDPDKEVEAEQAAAAQAQHRAALLERAARQDYAALTEAHSLGDMAFYREALDNFIARLACQEDLRALVSFIAKSEELRGSPRLAERVLEDWKLAPDATATAEALHIIALADDADMYDNAVETVLKFWKEGRTPNLSAETLRQLIDGEYWVMAAEARRSGAGFMLKRRIAEIRQELAKALS